MRILITSGGTREYIDAVRFITNMSTGGTGRVIAEHLSRAGHRVVCLCAEGAVRPADGRTEVIGFSGFGDLDAKMRALLKAGTFDAVIHLAAVSDYSPVSIKLGAKKLKPGRAAKLHSAADTMAIVLKRNFKILDRIKGYALENKKKSGPLVIGFKLTASASKKEVLRRVTAMKTADYVVHNDLEKAGPGKKHLFHIYKAGVKLYRSSGAHELAKRLDRILTAGKTRSE